MSSDAEVWRQKMVSRPFARPCAATQPVTASLISTNPCRRVATASSPFACRIMRLEARLAGEHRDAAPADAGADAVGGAPRAERQVAGPAHLDPLHRFIG